MTIIALSTNHKLRMALASCRSCQPQVLESPYGNLRVVGPAGYHMTGVYYSDPHERGDKKEKRIKTNAAVYRASSSPVEVNQPMMVPCQNGTQILMTTFLLQTKCSFSFLLHARPLM